MAIKLDCPRCKRPLSVPSKKAGQYANCPRCGGRFWVPENAAEASGELDEALAELAVPGPVAKQPTSRPAEQATKTVPPRPASPTPATATPVAPADSGPVESPEAGHKTARFVSAEVTASVLKPAEDGKLPELHLREGPQSERKQKQKDTTVNPLVLFGLLSLSVVLSIAMVLFEPASRQSSAKQEARRQIEQWFFPREGEKPLVYQEYLMAAQRANGRGDHETERRMYAQVLDLLRQQRPGYVEDNQPWSLTTSAEYDKKLEDQLCILLGDD